MKVLKTVIGPLLKGEHLPQKYREHQLVGEWKGYSECHLAPDWLLIFRRTEEELRLIRTGSHADLFE